MPAAYGNVARVRPERERALDQEQRVDRPRQRRARRPGRRPSPRRRCSRSCGPSGGSARAAPRSAGARAARGAPLSPNARARSFIFQNESWRSGERKRPLSVSPMPSSCVAGLAAPAAALGDDRRRIEALLVGARRRGAAAASSGPTRRRARRRHRAAPATAPRRWPRVAPLSQDRRIAARARGVSAMRAAQASTSPSPRRRRRRPRARAGAPAGGVLVAERQARPVQADDQRREAARTLLGRGAIGLLRRHRRRSSGRTARSPPARRPASRGW